MSEQSCVGCGSTDRDTRLGFCFDCASAGERRAAERTILQHVAHGFGRVLRGRFDFGTKMDFVWAWERLTRTGDYRSGGVFEREYGIAA